MGTEGLNSKIPRATFAEQDGMLCIIPLSERSVPLQVVPFEKA